MLGPTCERLKSLPLDLGELAAYMDEPLETASDLRVRLILADLLARRDLTVQTTITLLRSLPVTQSWTVTPEITRDLADAFGRLLGENWIALRDRLGTSGLDTLIAELRPTTYWTEPPADADAGACITLLCLTLALAYLCDPS